MLLVGASSFSASRSQVGIFLGFWCAAARPWFNGWCTRITDLEQGSHSTHFQSSFSLKFIENQLKIIEVKWKIDGLRSISFEFSLGSMTLILGSFQSAEMWSQATLFFKESVR